MSPTPTTATNTIASPRRIIPISPPASPARLGQIALGVIWCVDGLLKLQPYFFHHFAGGVIDPNAAGQPGIIGEPITWVVSVVRPHQGLFSLSAALTETSIGVALLVPRAVKPALLVSFAWALNIWLTGEGLGGLLTNATPDPLTGIIGTAPLYIVAGLLVWPRGERSGADRYRFGLLGEQGARLAWASLWLGAAALWLFPSNTGAGALQSSFTGAPSGAGWLSSLHADAAHAVGGSGSTLTVVLAVISAEIGLSILWVRGTRIALFSAVALSLIFWVLAEGFGGVFTGQATDLGTAPLMILIAALLLPLESHTEAAAAIKPVQPPRLAPPQSSNA